MKREKIGCLVMAIMLVAIIVGIPLTFKYKTAYNAKHADIIVQTNK